MEFKDKLKEIRKDRNLTQEQLAKQANISVRTIANYESGKREPNVEILVKISNALGVQVNDFYDNSDIAKINKKEISKIDPGVLTFMRPHLFRGLLLMRRAEWDSGISPSGSLRTCFIPSLFLTG